MGHAVVSDPEQLGHVFRRQLQFYVRTWRFVGLLIFTLLISGLPLLLEVVHFGTNARSADAYLSGFLGFLTLDAILVAAFLGGDAISMDFGSANGYYILVQPVRRIVLLLGRYLAAFVAAAAIGLTYIALGLLGASYFFGATTIPWGGVGSSAGLLLLFLLGVLSVAFAFSSLFRSPAVGMIVSVLVLWLGLAVIDGIAQFTGIEPWFSIAYAGGSIEQVLGPSVAHRVVIRAAGVSVTTFNPYLWESVAIMLAYFVLFLLASIVIYQYKESKG